MLGAAPSHAGTQTCPLGHSPAGLLYVVSTNGTFIYQPRALTLFYGFRLVDKEVFYSLNSKRFPCLESHRHFFLLCFFPLRNQPPSPLETGEFQPCEGWEHGTELAFGSAGVAVLTAMGTSLDQCPAAGGASSAFEVREPSKCRPPLALMPLIRVV